MRLESNINISKMRLSVMLMVIVLFFFEKVDADLIALTNKEGKEIKVEVVSVNTEEVTVRMRSGSRKLVTFPKAKLSEESLSELIRWKEEGGEYSKKFRIEFSAGMSRKRRRYTMTEPIVGPNQQITSRTVKKRTKQSYLALKPKLKITNTDTYKRSQNLEVFLFLFAQKESSSEPFILQRRNFSLPALKRHEKYEIEVPEYDSYSGSGFGPGSGSSGTKYAGFVILLKDGDRVVDSETSDKTLLEKCSTGAFPQLQNRHRRY